MMNNRKDLLHGRRGRGLLRRIFSERCLDFIFIKQLYEYQNTRDLENPCNLNVSHVRI